MRMNPNVNAVLGPLVPELRPRPDLGVPDPEALLAHFLAEHGGDSGYRIADAGMIEGLVAFGGFDCAPTWPSDSELAGARAHIGEAR